MSDPFADMNRRNTNEQVEADELLRWEQALVRHTCARFNLGPAVRRKLVDRYEQHTGLPALRFSAFNAAFQDFPFVLGATRLGGIHVHRDPRATEPARFKKFSQVTFVEHYRAFLTDVRCEGDFRSIGLIYPRKGFRYGMIIHNDDSEAFWEAGLCWVYKDPKRGNLYIQPYSSLLEQIKSSRKWRPGELQ